MPNGDIQFERVEDGQVTHINDGIYVVLNPNTNKRHQVTKDQIESKDKTLKEHELRQFLENLGHGWDDEDEFVEKANGEGWYKLKGDTWVNRYVAWDSTYAGGGEVSEGGNWLSVTGDKTKLVLTLTDDAREEIEEMRNYYDRSDSDIMAMLFEDIQANSELYWHDDLGNAGFGLTSASGITDGYYLNDDGDYVADWRHGDSQVYYFNDYALRSEVDDLLAGELVLTGLPVEEDSYNDGGEVHGYDVDEVLRHFIMAGLWASHDEVNEDSENLDENYSQDDVSEESISEIKRGIRNFINETHNILARHEISAEMVGHDLFLDSQGHGVGFWDRGYGDDGDTLSKASEQVFASDPPYVGDDGKIYFSDVDNLPFGKGGGVGLATIKDTREHLGYSAKEWQKLNSEEKTHLRRTTYEDGMRGKAMAKEKATKSRGMSKARTSTWFTKESGLDFLNY